jgi:hypothetical protein
MRLKEEITRLQGLLEKASVELVGTYETLKAQGKELARIRSQLTQENETGPLTMKARRVLEAWSADHPKANVDPNGARARLVRGAIKLGHTNPPIHCPVHDDGDKNAECTIPDELIEALEFLRMKPYVGPTGRTAEAGRGCRRFDDIKYALADEKTGLPSEAKIEKVRREVRRLKGSHVEILHEVSAVTANVNNYWTTLLLEALSERRRLMMSGRDAA